MTSPGIRSGVNWMRPNVERRGRRERAREQRLRGAGHALEQHVALAQQRHEQQVDRRRPGRRRRGAPARAGAWRCHERLSESIESSPCASGNTAICNFDGALRGICGLDIALELASEIVAAAGLAHALEPRGQLVRRRAPARAARGAPSPMRQREVAASASPWWPPYCSSAAVLRIRKSLPGAIGGAVPRRGPNRTIAAHTASSAHDEHLHRREHEREPEQRAQ